MIAVKGWYIGFWEKQNKIIEKNVLISFWFQTYDHSFCRIHFGWDFAPAIDRSIRRNLSLSMCVRMRKLVNYAWEGRRQGKLWWRPAALTCKSFVIRGHRGERQSNHLVAYIHTNIHTYIHTHTYIHIYTYIYIYICMSLFVCKYRYDSCEGLIYRFPGETKQNHWKNMFWFYFDFKHMIIRFAGFTLAGILHRQLTDQLGEAWVWACVLGCERWWTMPAKGKDRGLMEASRYTWA